MPQLTFPASPAHLSTYTDNNQAVWQYDSDGPFWNIITSTTRKNFSGVKAALNNSFDLTTSFQAIAFNNSEYDIDNYFSETPGKAIVPTTGFYRVHISIYTTSAGSGSSYTIQLRKNGTSIQSTTVGPNQNVNLDQTFSLVEGDYFEVFGKETTGTGGILLTSEMNVYRLGFAPGTGISNHNAFSGGKAIITQNIATTSTPTEVNWGTTEFNTNANVLGDLYWYSSESSRLTARANGYYRISCFVQTGTAGSNESYTIAVRKTDALTVQTTISTINLSPNDFIGLDEIIYLQEDEFIELVISNGDNTGEILQSSYLELVREGV